jgi:hypothetical protein
MTAILSEEVQIMLYARTLRLLEDLEVEDADERAMEFAEKTAVYWVANGYVMVKVEM